MYVPEYEIIYLILFLEFAGILEKGAVAVKYIGVCAVAATAAPGPHGGKGIQPPGRHQPPGQRYREASFQKLLQQPAAKADAAQSVAVGQAEPLSANFDYYGLLAHNLEAGGALQAAKRPVVVVSAQEIDLHAAVRYAAQRLQNPVVTHRAALFLEPEIEDVAQKIQGAGAGGNPVKKADKVLFAPASGFSPQMHVGSEDIPALLHRLQHYAEDADNKAICCKPAQGSLLDQLDHYFAGKQAADKRRHKTQQQG